MCARRLYWFIVYVLVQGKQSPKNSETSLTTDRIANELLEETLLTLEQITTGITVQAINGTRNPEQSPRVRQLLGDLLALIQETAEDLGTYAPS